MFELLRYTLSLTIAESTHRSSIMRAQLRTVASDLQSSLFRVPSLPKHFQWLSGGPLSRGAPWGMNTWWREALVDDAAAALRPFQDTINCFTLHTEFDNHGVNTSFTNNVCTTADSNIRYVIVVAQSVISSKTLIMTDMWSTGAGVPVRM